MTIHEPAASGRTRSRLRTPRILAAVLGALLVASAGLVPLSAASAAPRTIVVSAETCQSIAGEIGAQGGATVTPRPEGGSTCSVSAGYFVLEEDVTIEVPPGWTLALDSISSAGVIRTSASCGAAGRADSCGLILKDISNEGAIEIGSSASSLLADGSFTNRGRLVLGTAAAGAASPTFTNESLLMNYGDISIADGAVLINNRTVYAYCGSTVAGTVTGATPWDYCTPATLSGTAPDGRLGVNYSYSYSVAGDPRAGRDVRVVDGSLPPGLYLDFSGNLFGVPTRAGTFTFELSSTNVTGESRLVSTIVVSAVAPTISGALAAGMVGSDYYGYYTLTGGPAPAVSLVSGTLPPGVELLPSGELYGRPTTAGTFTFTVQAVNSAGSAQTTSTVTITPTAAVRSAADLSVDLSAPSSAAKGRAFTYRVTTKNAGPAAAASVFTKVVLPPGVQFVSATGDYKRFGPVVVFSTSGLAGGRTVTQSITVKSTATGDRIAAAATFSAKTPDPAIRDNADTATTRIR